MRIYYIVIIREIEEIETMAETKTIIQFAFTSLHRRIHTHANTHTHTQTQKKKDDGSSAPLALASRRK